MIGDKEINFVSNFTKLLYYISYVHHISDGSRETEGTHFYNSKGAP